MRIKKSIMFSYVIVMMIPALIIGLTLAMIVDSNNAVKASDYVTNTFIFNKYSKLLKNPDLYEGDFDYENIIEEEDKEKVNYTLYDPEGRLIYTSDKTMQETMNVNESKENLLKGLYERKSDTEKEVMKEPVYKDGHIFGIYKIELNREQFVTRINFLVLTGITIAVASLIFVIIFSNFFAEKRLNEPLVKLVEAMNGYAEGNFVQIESRRDDEIGEIIYQFNNMRQELEEKRQSIDQDNAEREYMVMAISHDLKTPLTAIRTNIELMKATGECNFAKLDGVIDKCDQMTLMLDNLMNYNLLQTGTDLDLAVVDGEEVMETLMFGYEDLIKSNELEPNIDVKLKGIYELDVIQIDRVIGNLVMNAIKYCSMGGRIDVGVYSEEYELPDFISKDIRGKYEDRKGKLHIIVRNDAPKLSERQLEKITMPFYKINEARNEKKGGFGLGLSIVALIVDKHKGEIDFYSEDDHLTIVIELDRRVYEKKDPALNS